MRGSHPTINPTCLYAAQQLGFAEQDFLAHLQNDMRFSSLCETELMTKRKRSILIKNQNEGHPDNEEASRNRNLSFNQNVQTEVSFKLDASN